MTPGAWTAVHIRHATNRAAAINALFAIGAEGVQELDAELVTHLRDIDEDRVRSAMRAADAGAAIEFAATPDVDWSSEWRKRITSHRIGPIAVTPPWLAGEFAPHERVVIEPAMAFGTGEHETTRGVIRLLPRFLRPGDMVADLGAGSAVLSIAAARLGAARVVAIELDPEAISNAEANVRSNEVADRVTVVEGDAALLLPLVAPVRLVLANIISSVLTQLLPVIGAALTSDGVAILSGILVEERRDFQAAAEGAGWRLLESDHEGMWWTAAIGR